MILEGRRALNYPEANDMFSVNFGISGLIYQTSTAQQLAMVVLLLNVAIVSIHIVWTMMCGKSSASWDSVTAIMVLAQLASNVQPHSRRTSSYGRLSYMILKKLIT